MSGRYSVSSFNSWFHVIPVKTSQRWREFRHEIENVSRWPSREVLTQIISYLSKLGRGDIDCRIAKEFVDILQ